jgi:hypothetical protein
MNGQMRLFNKATHQQQPLFRTVIALQMLYIFFCYEYSNILCWCKRNKIKSI